jgi:hypothetical protein
MRRSTGGADVAKYRAARQSTSADCYRETFNVDIEQPAQFDLLINASTTTLEAATEIVIDAFAAKLRRPSVAPIRRSFGAAVRRGARLYPSGFALIPRSSDV